MHKYAYLGRYTLCFDKKTPTFVFFYISYENNQICTKISVNAAKQIWIADM